MKRRKPSIQTHHITYNPEWTVKLWVGEHWVLTQLGRRKRVSRGFIVALKEWLRQNEKLAVNLQKGEVSS